MHSMSPLCVLTTFVCLATVTLSLPACVPGVPYAFAGVEYIATDWIVPEGCIFTGSASPAVVDIVNSFYFAIGLVSGKPAVRNVAFRRATITNLQFAFNSTFAYVNATPFSFLVEGCTLSVANRVYWSQLVFFESPALPAGSTITWSNNSVSLTTLSAASNYFSMFHFFGSTWNGVRLYIDRNRYVAVTQAFRAPTYFFVVSFSLSGGDFLLGNKSVIRMSNSSFSLKTSAYAASYAPLTHTVAILYFVQILNLTSNSGIEIFNNEFNVTTTPNLEVRAQLNLILFVRGTNLQDGSAISMSSNNLRATVASLLHILNVESSTMNLGENTSLSIQSCTATLIVSNGSAYSSFLRNSVFISQRLLVFGSNVAIEMSRNIVKTELLGTLAQLNNTELLITVFTVIGSGSNFSMVRLNISGNSIVVKGHMSMSFRGSRASLVYTSLLQSTVLQIDNRALILMMNNDVSFDLWCIAGYSNCTAAGNRHAVGILCLNGVLSMNQGRLTSSEVAPAGIHIVNSSVTGSLGYGVMTADLAVLSLFRLTILKGFHITIHKAIIDVCYNDTSSPFDINRYSSTFLGVSAFCSQSATALYNAASITVEAVSVNRNSSANNYSYVGMVAFLSKEDFRMNGSSWIIVKNCNVTVFVGSTVADNPFPNPLSDRVFLMLWASGSVLTNASISLVANAITVSSIADGGGAALPFSQRQQVTVSALLVYEATQSMDTIMVDANFTVSIRRNQINTLGANANYAMVHFNGVRLEVVLSSVPHIQLESNLAAIHANNSDTAALISFNNAQWQTSALSSAEAAAPFISMCKNYRNGYEDQSVWPINNTWPIASVARRGAQCSTDTSTSTLSVSPSQASRSSTETSSKSSSASDPTVTKSLPLSAQTATLAPSANSPTMTVSHPHSFTAFSSQSLTAHESPSEPASPPTVSYILSSPTVGQSLSVPLSASSTKGPSQSKSEAPSLSATLPLPPPPPPPTPIAVAKEDSEQVVGAIIAGGGGVLFPKAAGMASTAMAALRIAKRCKSDDNGGDDHTSSDEDKAPLSPFIHPLQFGVGSGDDKYRIGAIIGNCVIIPLIAALFLWAVLPILLQKWALPNNPSREDALVYAGWPSSLFLVTPPLVEGTSAMVAVLITSGLAGESMLGVAGGGMILATLGLWVGLLYTKVCRYRTELERSHERMSLAWSFMPLYERVPVGAGATIEEAELALKRWAQLFGDAAFLWSDCLGFACGIGVGVIEGVGGGLPCGVATALLLAFAIFQSAVACTTMVPAEFLIELLMGVCLVLLCTSALYSVINGDSFLSEDDENLLALLINILSLFGLIICVLEATFQFLRYRAAALFLLAHGFKVSTWSTKRKASAVAIHNAENPSDIPLLTMSSFSSASSPSSPVDYMDLFLGVIQLQVEEQQNLREVHRGSSHY